MRHEAFEAATTVAPTAAALFPGPLKNAGPIAVFRRSLDPVIAEAIDELLVELLPTVRVEGDWAIVDAALAAGLADLRRWQPWLEGWLRDDIAFLGRLFSELTGATSLAVRLEAVDDDACSRFHADNLSYRLVTTYRGAGTEWVSPRDAHLVQDGKLSDPSACRRLERGWVGALRGAKGATPDVPAVLHRSPPVRSPDAVRLFLAIDNTEDWPTARPAPV